VKFTVQTGTQHFDIWSDYCFKNTKKKKTPKNKIHKKKKDIIELNKPSSHPNLLVIAFKNNPD